MELSEALAEIKNLVLAHPTLFGGVSVELAFGEGRPCIGDWSNPENLGTLVTGDEIGNKSGLYFFTSLKGELLYIGKATKNNLHHRVWDHIKTPEVLADGRRTFPKHSLRGIGETKVYESNVMNGQVRLAVVTISDSDLVSLTEVYLHTAFQKKHGRLPVFNKQIG